jgi:hypothetical protein
VTKNHIENVAAEQACQLARIALPQRDPVLDTGFPRGAICELQHPGRRIQQRDVNAQPGKLQSQGSRARSDIERTQTSGSLDRRQKLLEIRKRKA